MRAFNVLVTAGSRRVPLVQSFRTALRSLGLPGVVIVTDVNPLSPAVHVADRAYRVPMSSDPTYIEEILAICDAERVRLVVPTIDDELPVFATAREAFNMVHAAVEGYDDQPGQYRDFALRQIMFERPDAGLGVSPLLEHESSLT